MTVDATKPAKAAELAEDEEAAFEMLHQAEEALVAFRRLTEQLGTLAVGAAGSLLDAAVHPTHVTEGMRQRAEEAVDLSLAWVEPARRLSEEQRRFAEEMAVWADRNRKFAEDVAAWAEAQKAFAARLEAWTSPLLTFSEQFGGAMKAVARITLPEGHQASEPASG